MKDVPPSPEKKDKAGLLLKNHRNTVASTKNMSPAILMGSSFAVAMGLFAWLGHRWDLKHDSEPLGVLVGVFVGFVYGAYEVWKVTRNGGGDALSSLKGESEEPQGPDKGE